MLRLGSRKLCSLAAEERADIIRYLANSLVNHQQEIMAANQQDLVNARATGVTGPLYDRYNYICGC